MNEFCFSFWFCAIDAEVPRLFFQNILIFKNLKILIFIAATLKDLHECLATLWGELGSLL